MKVAVASDSHDNFHNLVLFFNDVLERGDLERILFLGDFMNNGMAKFFAKFEIPTYGIWGNNDGEKVGITKTSCEEGSNLEMASRSHSIIKLGDRNLFLSHYPEIARPMAKSGEFDAVFYGHNHHLYKDFVNDCLLLNPGEISAHKTKMCSYAIYNTEVNDAEIITLDGSVSVLTDKVLDFTEKYAIRSPKNKSR